jgi:predicted DNA-binding transcriptional regulator AlpA
VPPPHRARALQMEVPMQSTANPARNLLAVKQAAARLGMSTSWLNKKRTQGGGPKFCKIGARCLYDEADLDMFKEQSKRGSTSEYDAG